MRDGGIPLIRKGRQWDSTNPSTKLRFRAAGS